MKIIINNTTQINTHNRHFISLTPQYASFGTLTFWLTNMSDKKPLLKHAQLCGKEDELTFYLDTIDGEDNGVYNAIKGYLDK